MTKMILLVIVGVLVVGFTVLAINARGQISPNRYAIQNVATGKNLRPYAAGKEDGNSIILYDHHSWKCMTWQLTHVENDVYKLKNRYTAKTFQTVSQPVAGVALCQQPITDSVQQEWEFIKTSKNSYAIRLKGTELYVTASSEKTNSAILLLPKDKSTKQQWRLVAQNPLF